MIRVGSLGADALALLPQGYALRVDLEAVAREAGVDLPDALAALGRIYEDVDRRNADNTAKIDLPCHQGCDACCHESVFMTPLEFFFAWDYAQRHFDDSRLAATIQTGLGLYAAHAQTIEALMLPPPQGAKDHFEIAQGLKFRCPLLGQDGACSVYPARELYARLFGCSFNDAGGIYGCADVGKALSGKTLKLLEVRPTARLLDDLPLTHFRQVYPFYIHMLYGA